MAARTLTVVRAWCTRIVAVAPGTNGVTHTICASCFDWTLTHPSASMGVEAIDVQPCRRARFRGGPRRGRLDI
jgi:hypothetical protein